MLEIFLKLYSVLRASLAVKKPLGFDQETRVGGFLIEPKWIFRPNLPAGHCIILKKFLTLSEFPYIFKFRAKLGGGGGGSKMHILGKSQQVTYLASILSSHYTIGCVKKYQNSFLK